MDGNSENLGLKIDNLQSKFDQSQINLVNSIEEKINNLPQHMPSFCGLHYRHGRNFKLLIFCQLDLSSVRIVTLMGHWLNNTHSF